MTKTKKCYILLFIICVCVFCLNCVFSSNIIVEADEIATVELYQRKIQNLIGNVNFEIDKIKAMKDFANNDFVLLETKPIGYFIFEKSQNELVEGSITSISPYLNYSKNLIYGGAQEYFVKQRETKSIASYKHCLENFEIINSFEYKAHSENLYKKIIEESKNKENIVKSRINVDEIQLVK